MLMSPYISLLRLFLSYFYFTCSEAGGESCSSGKSCASCLFPSYSVTIAEGTNEGTSSQTQPQLPHSYRERTKSTRRELQRGATPAFSSLECDFVRTGIKDAL